MYTIFFFNDTATTEIYTLSLHDALPISTTRRSVSRSCAASRSTTSAPAGSSSGSVSGRRSGPSTYPWTSTSSTRSEEHTPELQSRQYYVCRLLLEKKNQNILHVIILSTL